MRQFSSTLDNNRKIYDSVLVYFHVPLNTLGKIQYSLITAVGIIHAVVSIIKINLLFLDMVTSSNFSFYEIDINTRQYNIFSV